MKIKYCINLAKFFNMFKNGIFSLKKTQFLQKNYSHFFLILVSFFLNCGKAETLKSTFSSEPNLSNTLYFQRTKFSQHEDVFEKSCFQLNFLFFQPSERGNIVTYSEIYLSAYVENFLKTVNHKFPNSLKKYSIFEKVKEGKFQSQDSKIQIQFYQTKQKKLESNELVSLLDEFQSIETQKVTLEKEIWVLKFRKEDTLWKESEKVVLNGNIYSWIYHEFGELMYRHYPFIGYSVNDGEIIYSRLLGVEENIFFKQKEENLERNFKLYSNQDYAVYYFPNKEFLDFQIFSKDLKAQKTELTLLKNQFPILLYKKSLNTNGN
ncbi:MAG: hypothetical protein N3A69_14015 [Leptospiraceae bacterium]|nr:hypothetical protein [Leptospiraceae bacterium]